MRSRIQSLHTSLQVNVLPALVEVEYFARAQLKVSLIYLAWLVRKVACVTHLRASNVFFAHLWCAELGGLPAAMCSRVKRGILAANCAYRCGRLFVFVLDSRLQQDSIELGRLQLCSVLLSKDANYPWFILVPRRADVSELFDLSAADQQQLWKETTLLAEGLKGAYAADKMNVATLGNVVSQLHMHVIVRKHDDAAWPAPVWGRVPAIAYTPAQVQALRIRLAQLLGSEWVEVRDDA